MPKPTKPKQNGTGSSDLSARAKADPRFATISTDPRFRLPSKKHTRVSLDKRFAHMLKDDDFARKATIDRYGRKISSDEGRKRLEKFYHMDDDDTAEKGDDQGVDEDDDDEEEEDKKVYDPARQGGFSSSEDDSSEDEEEEVDLENEQGVDVAEANAFLNAHGATDDIEGEVTRRVAMVNLDWDNIRAVDLMAVAQSFCPKNGHIESVVVYPSQFGREAMEREEREGPPKELFQLSGKDSRRKGDADSAQEDDEDDEDESGFGSEDDEEEEQEEDDDDTIRRKLLPQREGDSEELNPHALRNYQLTRLRYYYAILTTDTPSTAKAIYEQMDGREYLTSANFFDLSFVPDDTDFDDDVPRDQCTKVPAGYRPNDFTTEALTHSKVKLTWDEDNEKERGEIRKRAFGRGELADEDLKAYLGSDSSDDEDQDDARAAPAEDQKKESKAEAARRKMREALGLPAEAPLQSTKKGDEPQGGMQITFAPGLTAQEKQKGSVFENKPEDVIEETTVEKYRRKEKERKAKRKAKAKAARNGDELDDSESEEQPSANDDDNNEDDPFNDPFFNDPAAANAAARKQAKRQARAAADAEQARSAAQRQKERQELELLMQDENGDASAGAHFNMDEIRRAEKAEARKGKKGKRSKKAAAAVAAVPDSFEMDVQDERFRGVFDSHEFAIDPSNPRFSGTKGMKRLLEEGRRKRKDVVDEAETRGSTVRGGGDDVTVDQLVQKLKRRKVQD